MRVEVDPQICEANGVCMGIAPAIFTLDEDDILHIVDPELRAGTEALIRDAVAQCPRAALSVVE
ncbi:ferredoxin [Nocardia sp. NPDC057663]|uniref:ferredoxin n=1 Tax=Nocardia sp. NPDC057663 TaxID=3346201 RepID=UPI00366C794B